MFKSVISKKANLFDEKLWKMFLTQSQTNVYIHYSIQCNILGYTVHWQFHAYPEHLGRWSSPTEYAHNHVQPLPAVNFHLFQYLVPPPYTGDGNLLKSSITGWLQASHTSKGKKIRTVSKLLNNTKYGQHNRLTIVIVVVDRSSNVHRQDREGVTWGGKARNRVK